MTELDPFVAALRAKTERMRVGTMPQPDVVDVVDRALDRDPDAVPTGLREVIEDEADESEVPAPDLAAFAAALQGRTETVARQRRMRALPRPPQRPTRARRWPLAVAVAAAVVLVAGVSTLRGTTLTPEQSDPSGSASERIAPTEREDHQAEARTPGTPRSRRQVERHPPPPQSSPEELEVEPEPRAEPGKAPARPKVSLDELEAQAQRRWAAGDLAGADKALRAVIRRAGRSRQAELAYADLFAVASQRGGAKARAKVWKEYLRKFPQGRFSDDVSGGLCRRTPPAQQPTCWRRYLAAHPNGTHADEARAVLSTPSP